MADKPFRFKQFTIKQNKCAMKVGTDGVLLGAWANITHKPFSILDIGAGTGIISLMLAQRSNAEVIDALEIDEAAYEQCVENFENSPWSDRLFCYHASLQEFTDEIDDTYDLIVSNPPFYTTNFKSSNNQRDLARFEDALPFERLIESAAKFLSEIGKFVVIIPYNEEENFIRICENHSLFASHILKVKGNQNTEIKRSLITFSFEKIDVVKSELIIETNRHQYTEDYTNLVKDFYLKM